MRRRELALIDRLWRAWSPSFTLDSARSDELHAFLERSLPAPLEYYSAIVRPLTTFVDRMRKAEAHIATSLLQLHGRDDGCIVPPTDEDRRWFDARVLEVVPNLGHFLHVEARSPAIGFHREPNRPAIQGAHAAAFQFTRCLFAQSGSQLFLGLLPVRKALLKLFNAKLG